MKLKTMSKNSTIHHRPNQDAAPGSVDARIKVVTGGCSHCAKLTQTVIDAMEELGMPLEDMRQITDIKEMVRLGVVATPALIIDGGIVSTGKLLSLEDIKVLLLKYCRQR